MTDIEKQQLAERRSIRPGELAAINNRHGHVEVRRVAARNWALVLVDNGVEYWVGSGNAVNQGLDCRLRGRATQDDIDAAEERGTAKRKKAGQS